MKKLLLTLFTVLTALQGWGVAQQTYTDPSQLPEAFEWTMVRYDYRGTDENGDPILVNTQDNIVVTWNPNSSWSTTVKPIVTRYGKLTISNFYHTECTQVESVTIEFENRINRNFKWNDDHTQLTFSFTAYNWSTSKEETPYTTYTGYKSGHKWAFISTLTTSGTNKMTWWEDGETSPMAYGNGAASDCVIDLINKTITINNAWGCIMMKSSSGGSSTLVEYFEKSIFREKEPTTLAWIEANGEKEQSYTIADRLMGVYANDKSLWCKDLGNISNVKTEPATGAIDYMSGLMSELHQRSTADEWDQSNWVELVCDNADMADSGKGKYIKAGTVTGKYTDDVNYTIRVTGTSLELDGEATYEPNYYSPVNFMCYSSAEQDNTSVQGTYGGRTYYFVNPKVQEYAIPTIAVWRGNNEFAMAARDVESDRPMNTAGLPGAYKVQWGLNNMGNVSGSMSEHEAYEFHAIVRRATNDEAEPASVPARAQSTLEPMSTTASADYEVWPLDLDPKNFNIVTEITAVGSDEPDGDGYYYTLTGQRVTNPAPGFYIHNGRKVIVR